MAATICGDFAVLVERLRVIRLRDTAADDAFLMFLTEEPARTPYLFELDLAGTRITDKGLHALEGLSLLQRLDLSGTRVTKREVWAAVEALPTLEEVGLEGTGIGWFSRWRLVRFGRTRKAENERRMLLGKLTEADHSTHLQKSPIAWCRAAKTHQFLYVLVGLRRTPTTPYGEVAASLVCCRLVRENSIGESR